MTQEGINQSGNIHGRSFHGVGFPENGTLTSASASPHRQAFPSDHSASRRSGEVRMLPKTTFQASVSGTLSLRRGRMSVSGILPPRGEAWSLTKDVSLVLLSVCWQTTHQNCSLHATASRFVAVSDGGASVPKSSCQFGGCK